MVVEIHNNIDLYYLYIEDWIINGISTDAASVCAEVWWNDDYYNRDYNMDVIRNE